MAARFGEVVEDGPEVRRGDLGEPMLAGGAEDEQGSNGRSQAPSPSHPVRHGSAGAATGTARHRASARALPPGKRKR